MRRTIAIVALVLVALALAGPAAAQDIPKGARDPFEPLLTTDTTGATGAAFDGGTTTGTGTTSGAPNTGISGGLSNTGADISPWLAASYLLIAFGAAAVAWSRIKTPHTR